MTKILNSKKDFQDLMLEILNPLKSYYSEDCCKLHLGDTFAHYGIEATYMEAISRPLWALTPFWAGGGEDEDFLRIYRKALANATDKGTAGYWGDCVPFDQRFVEMAAISFNLMYTPESIWMRMSEVEQKNLAEYLYQINEHPLPVCNWILFAVMVNVALKERGMRYCKEMMEEYLDGLETFYLGEGWYCDGDSGQKDYYISFAIHYYTLIYADRMKEEDPERAGKYRERAMQFAKQFVYWFDEDGDAIPFGRSLTYRFAQVSFFSICLLTGLEPFPVNVMKGLIVRHLNSWLSRPIFDRDGILTIGYGYPNLRMAERYNAPGSPYWGMKAFAFLGLPDEHPFWSVEPAPLPNEMKEQPICSAQYADMLIYHYGNHTTAFAPGVYSPFGHGHIVEKYSKFAYDSKFSISIAHSQYELEECAPDNMLAFFINGYVYVRRHCTYHEITENSVISHWSPYPGIQVETTIIPNQSGHTRIHKIISEIECDAYEYGFSIRRDDSEKVSYEEVVKEDVAIAWNKDMRCKIMGEVREGAAFTKGACVLHANPNTNLLYPKTSIPGVKYGIVKGKQTLVTKIIIGDGDFRFF